MTDTIAQRIAKEQKARSRSRWHELNTFVDVTLKDLTPAQAIVWLCLWRHQKNSTVDSTVRQVAKLTGLSTTGTHNALAHLRRIGLVEVLKPSKSHAENSVYRVRDRSTELNSTVQFRGSDRSTELNIYRRQKAARTSAAASEGGNAA